MAFGSLCALLSYLSDFWAVVGSRRFVLYSGSALDPSSYSAGPVVWAACAVTALAAPSQKRTAMVTGTKIPTQQVRVRPGFPTHIRSQLKQTAAARPSAAAALAVPKNRARGLCGGWLAF